MTKTRKQSLKVGKYVWIIFAFMIVALYFCGLTIPLVGPDEPRYAQIAREMFERGDFITPKLGGFDWFEKPALLYWLEIASFKMFGVSEFSARFGSALFGLGTVFSVWVLGRSFQKRRDGADPDVAAPSPDFANWLALITASTIGLLAFSRGASFDIIIAFPITASLVLYYLFDRTSEENRYSGYLYLLGFYFFIGLALLAKGLIGIVFPTGIVAFYHVLSAKRPSRTLIASLFWGTAVALLIAGTWYIPMYQANGWKFIDEFFIQHHFQRYVSNKYQHPQPFWFFGAVLPLMTLPWLPLFAASVWDFARKSFGHKETTKTEQNQGGRTFFVVPFSNREPLLLFAISWLLVPLFFFSFSGSKLPGYILPALPAACIFGAEYADRFVQKGAWRKVILQITALLTIVIAFFLLQFVVPGIAYGDSVKGLFETAAKHGFTNEKVFNLHTVSHNAEFYAAGRIVRDENGKIRKFLGPPGIARQMRDDGARDVLVLVPPEFLDQLIESDQVDARVLDNNGELVIVAVRIR